MEKQSLTHKHLIYCFQADHLQWTKMFSKTSLRDHALQCYDQLIITIIFRPLLHIENETTSVLRLKNLVPKAVRYWNFTKLSFQQSQRTYFDQGINEAMMFYVWQWFISIKHNTSPNWKMNCGPTEIVAQKDVDWIAISK